MILTAIEGSLRSEDNCVTIVSCVCVTLLAAVVLGSKLRDCVCAWHWSYREAADKDGYTRCKIVTVEGWCSGRSFSDGGWSVLIGVWHIYIEQGRI